MRATVVGETSQPEGGKSEHTRTHTHCVYDKHMYTHHANPCAHTFCYFINVFGVMLCLCVLRLCPTGSLHVGQCWRRLPAVVSHSLTVKHVLRSCNNPGGARHHIRTHLHVKVACPRRSATGTTRANEHPRTIAPLIETRTRLLPFNNNRTASAFTAIPTRPQECRY